MSSTVCTQRSNKEWLKSQIPISIPPKLFWPGACVRTRKIWVEIWEKPARWQIQIFSNMY